MATATIQDYRRTDLRANVLENPYWISSAVVDAAVVSGLKDKACVLFSFPTAGQQVVIWDCAIYIATAWTATTVLDVGSYTLATDAVTTAGSATLVDVDDYIPTASITATTGGWYYPAAGDWLTARAAGTHVNPANLIVGAATTVPCIAITPSTSTPIIGQAQVHLLISILPGT